MTNTPTVATPPNNLSTAALAAELATRLYPVVDTLKRFGLTADQLKHLMTDPQFRHQIKEYRREWSSPLSAKERVKVKASLMVEDGLLELHHIFHDVAMNPQARLDAFKQAVNLADMQPKANAQEVGPSFKFIIELGSSDNQKREVVIDAVGKNIGGEEVRALDSD